MVIQNTRIVARGYQPEYVGVDIGTPAQGCVQYRWNNPAKNGLVEDKVSYGLKVNDGYWIVAGTYLIKR